MQGLYPRTVTSIDRYKVGIWLVERLGRAGVGIVRNSVSRAAEQIPKPTFLPPSNVVCVLAS